MSTSAVTATSAGRAQGTVRRIVLFTLLFVLVVIAAIGVSGLIWRLIDTGLVIEGGDVGGLAQALAFTLIAGPLAVILWFVMWRRLAAQTERASLAWALYLAVTCTVALITFTTSLLSAAASGIAGEWRPSDLANGLVWAVVWAWHRWMLRHRAKSPARMPGVADLVAVAFGLLVGVGGLITALGTLLAEALTGASGSLVAEGPWWRPMLQAGVWAVGGALIWWWHWTPMGARTRRTVFADVVVNGIGVLIPAALTLGGIATGLFVLLRLAFDRSDPLRVLLDPMGMAIAAALVGALVWAYHRGWLRVRSSGAREAAALITSGVALAFAATGVGVIVNAALGAITPTLAGGDTRTLLLGGIASLVVGAPVWWLFWRRTERVTSGRRVYLILVFGVSAIVALIALLVVGFRVFEFLIDARGAGSLIDRIRAPFGLLLATALVSGYHFGVWRRDRAVLGTTAPARPHTIGRVTLIMSGESSATAQAIEAATGATVRVWTRADAGTAATETPDAARLSEALAGVTGDQVVVIVGPGSRIEVIPIER